jgi:Arm domain-containing DNA-binding protein
MPRIKLTKSAIDTLPVPPKERVYWDAGLPGFGVKVTPKGKRVFIVLYRAGGAGSRLRKYTVGPYGRITLAMARAQAQKIFAARLDGRDPAAEKANSRRRLVVDRVDGLVETFIVERLSGLRSGPAVARRLRSDVIPRWGSKSIHEIKRRDIVDLVSEVAQRGPGANRNIAKFLKTFFRWCVGRAVIDFSPVEGLNLRPPDRARDRALDDRHPDRTKYARPFRRHPRSSRYHRPAPRGSCPNELERDRRDNSHLAYPIAAGQKRKGPPGSPVRSGLGNYQESTAT